MSTKIKKIIEANLLSEQRYLNNKFIFENPINSGDTTTSQTPETPEDVQTSSDITKMGINVNDTATQQSILKQLEPHKDKVNMGYLKQNLGKPSFFDVLGNYMKFDLEKDSKLENSLLPSQSKTATGEEATFKLGNLSLKGTFDFRDKQVGDIGLNYKTKIDHQPVTITAKLKDPVSTFSGNFNPSNVQVGAKLSIPSGKKSHGTQL
jgi:hypothetical protein